MIFKITFDHLQDHARPPADDIFRPLGLFGDFLRRGRRGTTKSASKRVLFDGERKNTAIRLSNVLSVIPYSDGAEIEKTSGRSPIFTVGDPEWLTVLLTSRLAYE